MRSLLIVPAEERRLAQALESAADALVVDLGSAAPHERVGARAVAARFLNEARCRPGLLLIVRANALVSGNTDADLDAVMPSSPDAILLPGSLGASSIQQLSAKLAVHEANLGLDDRATKIIAVADTAQSLFSMGSYRGSSARLLGVAWSADALRGDIGAETERDGLGGHLGAHRLARELTLLAATSARVAAVDGVFRDVRDQEGLRANSLAARRDGFTAKIAIDAAQVAVINETFRQGNASGPESGA